MGADPPFRFEVGETVVVRSHAGRPPGTIVARWPGAELEDPYRENIYQLSSFVTKQRESSLAPAAGTARRDAGVEVE